MNLLLLCVALGATPAPVKLAAPSFSFVGVTDKRGEAYVEFLSDQLRTQGLSVVTRSQITALLGFEREKQLLGCTEASQSCLADLAGALGADGLLTGSVNRTSRGTFIITLTVVGAVDGRTVASGSVRAPDEEALYDFLSRFAQDNGARIHQALAASTKPAGPRVEPAPVASAPQLSPPPPRRPAVTAPPAAKPPAPAPAVTASAPPGSVRPGWVVAGAGGAAVIAGAIVYGLAAAQHGKIEAGTATFADRTALDRELRGIGTMQTVSALLVGGGAALAAGGTIWALLPTPSLALHPTGAHLGLAWELR